MSPLGAALAPTRCLPRASHVEGPSLLPDGLTQPKNSARGAGCCHQHPQDLEILHPQLPTDVLGAILINSCQKPGPVVCWELMLIPSHPPLGKSRVPPPRGPPSLVTLLKINYQPCRTTHDPAIIISRSPPFPGPHLLELGRDLLSPGWEQASAVCSTLPLCALA